MHVRDAAFERRQVQAAQKPFDRMPLWEPRHELQVRAERRAEGRLARTHAVPFRLGLRSQRRPGERQVVEVRHFGVGRVRAVPVDLERERAEVEVNVGKHVELPLVDQLLLIERREIHAIDLRPRQDRAANRAAHGAAGGGQACRVDAEVPQHPLQLRTER